MSDFGADIFDPPPPRRRDTTPQTGQPALPPVDPGPGVEAAGGASAKVRRPRKPRKPRSAVAEGEPAAELPTAPAPTTENDVAAAEPPPPARRRARRRTSKTPEPEPTIAAPTVVEPAPTAPETVAKTSPPHESAEAGAAPGAPSAPEPTLAPEGRQDADDPLPRERPTRPKFADAPGHRAFQGQRRPREEPRAQTSSAPTPAAAFSQPTTRPRRVAVLLDLPALQQEARQRGAELSFRKLLPALAGDNRVVAAWCYLPRLHPEIANCAVKAIGFKTRAVADHDDLSRSLSTDVAALPPDVDTIVLSPAGPAQQQLAARLRGDGRHVELAGFLVPPEEQALRLLGRDCVFVP